MENKNINGEKYQDFTSLEVWKLARLFQHEMYTIAKTFPIEEKYCLTDQLIRSSRSIASNISEGHGRYHFKEQIRYFIISRGSLTETLNHLITAFDCRYITEEQLQVYREKYLQILKLINGYIAFLRKQKDNFVND